MQRKYQMPGEVAAFKFPALVGTHEPVEKKPSWLEQRLHDARIIMVTSSPPPKMVNWTTVTGLCAVFTFFLMLMGIICAGVWYMSAQASQMQKMQEQINAAQSAAQQAKDIALAGTEAEEPKKKEPKK